MNKLSKIIVRTCVLVAVLETKQISVNKYSFDLNTKDKSDDDDLAMMIEI